MPFLGEGGTGGSERPYVLALLLGRLGRLGQF
jgi:hypothetical protein